MAWTPALRRIYDRELYLALIDPTGLLRKSYSRDRIQPSAPVPSPPRPVLPTTRPPITIAPKPVSKPSPKPVSKRRSATIRRGGKHYTYQRDVPRVGEERKCVCGDLADTYSAKKEKWLCLDCEMELVLGIMPPLEKITSGGSHHPHGVEIIRRGVVAGAGEGNDYFGNHT